MAKSKKNSSSKVNHVLQTVLTVVAALLLLDYVQAQFYDLAGGNKLSTGNYIFIWAGSFSIAFVIWLIAFKIYYYLIDNK